MKWIFLIALIGGIVPLSQCLRANPREAPKVWALMGFLPFAMGPLHLFAAPISWAGWPGYVKGIEFTALDALAIAVYLALPRAKRRPLPFRFSMILYFTTVVLSIFQSGAPMATFFYVWQMARMFLVYAVFVRASEDNHFVPAVLSGMAFGLTMEGGVTLLQKFEGISQPGGTFGHQNLLGMVALLPVFPLAALLLAGQRSRLVVLGPLAGIVIAALTASRGTAGFECAGYAAVFLLSAWRKWTPRKARVLSAGLMIVIVAAPVAYASFEQRFALNPLETGYDERAAFIRAALMMLDDHPFGVGANNYVVIANSDGYNHDAGVAWGSGNSTNVHILYLLAAVETGYTGMLALALLLIRPLLTAFICGFRTRDLRGDLLLAFGVSLSVAYVHSCFEWILITYPAQYMLYMVFGMVAGLTQQLGYWGRVPAPRLRIVSTNSPTDPVAEPNASFRRPPARTA